MRLSQQQGYNKENSNKEKEMNKATLKTMAVVLFATATAYGFGPQGGGEMPKMIQRDKAMMTLQELDLSSTQREQLKAMRNANMAEKKTHRADQQQKREEVAKRRPLMTQYMSATAFDKEGFKKAIKEEIAQNRAMMEKRSEEMIERRANRLEQIFNILTPEQRVKWIALSEDNSTK